MEQKRSTEARIALQQLRQTQDVADEYNAIEESIRAEASRHSSFKWRELLNPPVAQPLLVGCILQVAQQLCGINIILYYSSTILSMGGFKRATDAIWLSSAIAFSNFAFGWVGLLLVDRYVNPSARDLIPHDCAGLVVVP